MTAPRPNFRNRPLFHGDNLPVLRAMNTGCVDRIATDPPFNKGKDFHATPDGDSAGTLAFGEIYYATEPPERTDDGDEAAPFLRVKERIREPAEKKMSRSEMYDFLLAQYGQKCQGCDRAFDDPRYLQLDHNTPRSDGGLNHITNRVLLCGPCNRAKSNIYTLTGLRRLNKRKGWMAP